MRCNSCWRELEGRAVSTTCGHLLCTEDANKILNNDAACPICDQVLSKSLMKPVEINPNDEWINMAMAGISPQIYRNPSSMDKRDNERRCVGIYNRHSMDEEAFFKQKSRIQWLELGDRNTTFFHKSLVHRQTRNRIQELRDERGNVSADPKSIARIAESYYKDLLTSTANRQHYHRQNLFARRIPLTMSS